MKLMLEFFETHMTKQRISKMFNLLIFKYKLQ